MIIIDNYDSFTYNIVQYLRELGASPKIFKNDEISVSALKEIDTKSPFSSIIISPGPKNPDGAGVSLEVISEFHKTKKILGICLGHQCIAQYFGCKIVKSKNPMHGKVSKIYFEPDELFEGLEQGFEATRYHSLVVDNESLTEYIKPLAWTNDNTSIPLPFTLHSSPLMALKNKDYPIYGVQFHPEAILTQEGKKLLSNFLNIKDVNIKTG